VVGEEQLDEVGVGDLLRVVDHAHGLGVAGPVGADVLVAGVQRAAARVADGRLDHAGDLAEEVLDAPEAARREDRGGLLVRELGLGRQALLGREHEAGRVQAVALAGGLGAVVEDVAEVPVAAGAEDLGAHHAVAVVGVLDDVLLRHGLEVAGPAGARVELGVAAEERQAAAGAGVEAVLVVVVEQAAEGGLGARPAHDLVGLVAELGLPLLVGLDDLGHRERAGELALVVEQAHGDRRDIAGRAAGAAGRGL
jgi:hypothetical protein